MWFGHLLTLCLGFSCIIFVHALGCFKCSSTNHDNVKCEDPFTDDSFFESDCWAPRDNGLLLPATQCIKVTVTDDSRGYNLVVRDCVTDNGDLVMNTEIGRISHCSWMGTGVTFDDYRSNGCLEVCDSDGCNGGDKLEISWFTNLICLIFSTVYMYIYAQ